VSELKLLVVGAGRRVVEDVLPVLDTLAGTVSLTGILARTSRTEELAGRPRTVTALDEALAAGLHQEADVVYVVVAKGAVPGVLGKLASAGAPSFGLLLETPGLLLKHLGHLRKLSPFPSVIMAEDCVALPWVSLVKRAVAEGPLGPLQEVVLDRSAWRYHGVALLKALLDAPITSARRRSTGGENARVDLRVRGGGRGLLIEPRDYATGHVVLVGRDGTASDAPERVPGALPLAMEPAADGSVDLVLGPQRETLSPEEAALVGDVAAGDRVTAHMHGLKRVGLRRLLMDRAAGRPGYPLSEGLDDMAVDAVLEKAGRWLATPITSLRSPLARSLAGLALRPLARG
jgi:hypothetical protein